MAIKINGKETAYEENITVMNLLKLAEVEMPEYVSVQLNDEILDRSAFGSRIVKDGDEVELLYYMGGGAGA